MPMSRQHARNRIEEIEATHPMNFSGQWCATLVGIPEQEERQQRCERRKIPLPRGQRQKVQRAAQADTDKQPKQSKQADHEDQPLQSPYPLHSRTFCFRQLRVSCNTLPILDRRILHGLATTQN